MKEIVAASVSSAVKGWGIHVPLIVIMNGEKTKRSIEYVEVLGPNNMFARVPMIRMFIAVKIGFAREVKPANANGDKNAGNPGMKSENRRAPSTMKNG